MANKQMKKCSVLLITCACAELLQSCLALCDPVDCSPQGSSVPGILQAKILEWVAMPSSRGVFQTQGWNPHLLHLLDCRQFLDTEPWGKPIADY